MRRVHLDGGTPLFRQVEAGDAVYFVASGRLVIGVTRDDGQEVRLGEVGPGESVGEMALLSGEPRMAGVVADTDAELLRLSKSGYDLLVARAPQALAAFARVMAERLTRSARSRQAVTAIRANPFVTLDECAAAIAAVDPARRRFPDLLVTLERPDLAEMFARFDRGLPTRAIDWSALDGRMRYIANLFRSRQKSLELFEPPFLFEQQTAILAGQVPDGPL